jgi:hypothetical protein
MGRGIATTLAALAVALASLSASVAASASTVSASTVPRSTAPAVGAATSLTDELDQIWCASHKSCIAVGGIIGSSSTAPLAETWNGSGWKKAKLPSPAGWLDGLSCVSAKHCVAVGRVSFDQGLALTWTGSGWTAATPPGNAGGGSDLLGVSCRSATSCVAVGSYLGKQASVAYSDILVGKTWVGKTVPVPKGTFLSQLKDVSCPSASFCVAVGYATTIKGVTSMLVDAWNGKSWSAMKPAKPSGVFRGEILYGVSCVSAKSCVAVGSVGNPAELLAVTETWNGKTWRYAKVSWPKGVKNTQLDAISCLSAGHCVAVGSTGVNPVSNFPTGRAAAVTWNGKAWKAQSVPAPAKGKFSALDGLYCQKSFCAAAGMTGPSGSGRGTALAGFSAGSSWKLVAAG